MAGMGQTSLFQAGRGTRSHFVMDRPGQVQVDAKDLRCAVNSESSVLISGGTREIRFTLAEMIHLNRAGRDGRFVTLDKAESLLPWLAGDTLFVEEINQLSRLAGEQLGRLIEERRAGLTITPRVIAGTGDRLDLTPLPVAIPEELFYRLNIIHIALPSVVGHGDLASIFGRRGM